MDARSLLARATSLSISCLLALMLLPDGTPGGHPHCHLSVIVFSSRVTGTREVPVRESFPLGTGLAGEVPVKEPNGSACR